MNRGSPLHRRRNNQNSIHDKENNKFLSLDEYDESLSKLNNFISDNLILTTCKSIDMFRPSKEALWKTKMNQTQLRLTGQTNNIFVPGNTFLLLSHY